jgi:hypothetical protein
VLSETHLGRRSEGLDIRKNAAIDYGILSQIRGSGRLIPRP